MTFEITKSFTFDAAHQLSANVAPGHRYGTVHGHSFEAELAFAGEPDPATGWIRDFEEINAVVAGLRATLDHSYLNDVPGLERPTLERLCQWLWDHVKPQMPELVKVSVRRGSCREGCSYTGPDARA